MPKFFYNRLIVLFSVPLCLGFSCLFLLQRNSATVIMDPAISSPGNSVIKNIFKEDTQDTDSCIYKKNNGSQYIDVCFLKNCPVSCTNVNKLIGENQIGRNFTTFLLLSKRMLNFEKMSLRPRINGVCSLLENAQGISIGFFVSLSVIFPMYVMMGDPSIPQKDILFAPVISTCKTLVRDKGTMVQSAPVSTKNSKGWYPYLVRTGMAMIGSRTVPIWVCLSLNGNSAGIINIKEIFTGNKSDCQFGRVDTLLGDFFIQLLKSFRMEYNAIIFMSDVFTTVFALKPGIRNSFHLLPSWAEYNIAVFKVKKRYQQINGIYA